MGDDCELTGVREYGSGQSPRLSRASDVSQQPVHVIRVSVSPRLCDVAIDVEDLLSWLASPAGFAALSARGLPTICVQDACPGTKDPDVGRPSAAWLLIGLMRQARSGLRVRTSDARTRDWVTELLRRGWVKVAVDAAGGDSAPITLTNGGAEVLAWAEELLLDLAATTSSSTAPPSEGSDALDDLRLTGLRLTEAALHARGRADGVGSLPSDGGLTGSSSYCAGYVVGSNARLGILGDRALCSLEAFARDSPARHRAEAVAAALSFVRGGPPIEGHHEVALRALLESARSREWRDDLRDLLAAVSFKTGGSR